MSYDVNEEVGRNVRHKRTLRKLTQEQLGKQSGLSRLTIINIEAGRAAELETLEKVATALGCRLRDIIP